MAESKIKPDGFGELPTCALEYINLVIKAMRYRKKVREEVREELIDHFEEYLKDCVTNEEKEQKAHQLISEFGDAKMLAKLMRRAKKRCRPLWQKILVRGLACALIISAYLFICAAWLRMGSPTIKINYAQWFTDQQRQGRDESLNAMPEINKAAELVIKVNDSNNWNAVYDILRLWPGDMNDTQKAAEKNFLSASNEAIETLNAALEKPYCWTDYNTIGPLVIKVHSMLVINPQLMESRLQPLAQYRQLAKALAIRINWRAYSGDIDGAVDDTILLLRFASHLEQQDLLAEQLVAVAIEALALQRTIFVLSRADVPAEQIKRLQEEISVCSSKHEFPIDLKSERVFWYALIQQGFTDDGKDNGRILRGGTIYFVSDWKDAIWSFLTFGYPDRQQALAEIEKTIAERQQNILTTPWEKKDKILSKSYIGVGSLITFYRINPAYDMTSSIAWRFKTHRETTMTILAALRYQKEKGKYPDTLDELVKAGYLTKVPADAFGPGPLTYKKTEEGFLLYSWGENLKDDNGEVVRTEKGKIRQFAETGDWVFWPVEKN